MERVKTGKSTPGPMQENSRYPEGVKKFTIDRVSPATFENQKLFTSAYGKEMNFYLIV